MPSNFCISDLISRINVALSRRLVSVYVERSVLNINLLDLFYKNGIIRGFVLKEDNSTILFLLKYYLNSPVPRTIRLISKPGRRIF